MSNIKPHMRRITFTIRAFLVAAMAASACATVTPSQPVEIEYDIVPVAAAYTRLAHTEAVAAATPRHHPQDVRKAQDATLAFVHQTLKANFSRFSAYQRLPEQPHYSEILATLIPDVSHSLSLGTPAGGRVLNSVTIPLESPYHSVIEKHRARNTQDGTEQIVDAILFAAQQVHEELGGAPLRIGNIGRPGGGRIPWSRSHQVGRDADLAFYVVDEEGNSVPAPDLMNFEDDGRCVQRPELRFDVARNWALTKAFLRWDGHVQWLFISLGLKAMLLEHARDIGEDEELIRRASLVLHQPMDALPHDDHFHLRIGCPEFDRLEGCIDVGPQWDWYDWHRPALLARSLALKQGLQDPDAGIRLAVLDELERIRSPFAPEVALARGVYDAEPQIRARALELARTSWPYSSAAAFYAGQFIRSPASTPEERIVAYSILRRGQDPLAREFALEQLADASIDPREKVYASRVLMHFMEPELVEDLIAQLRIQPGPVRAELVRVLQRITNRADERDWRLDRHVEDGHAEWVEWWEEHGHLDRDSWLRAGFREHGWIFEEHDQDFPNVVETALRLFPEIPEHMIYNLNRFLRDTTGRWAPLETVDGQRLQDYWQTWWRRNRDRYLHH